MLPHHHYPGWIFHAFDTSELTCPQFSYLEMLYLDIEYWTDVWKSLLRAYGEDCLEQFNAARGENG